MIAEILTAWTGNGRTPETAYRPAVAEDYTVSGYTDITCQMEVVPQPNLFSALIECDLATLSAIRSNPNYWVLWWADG